MKFISVEVLAHLVKDHPIEGVIAQKMIDAGELTVGESFHPPARMTADIFNQMLPNMKQMIKSLEDRGVLVIEG
jgi:hypothetical protein